MKYKKFSLICFILVIKEIIPEKSTELQYLKTSDLNFTTPLLISPNLNETDDVNVEDLDQTRNHEPKAEPRIQRRQEAFTIKIQPWDMRKIVSKYSLHGNPSSSSNSIQNPNFNSHIIRNNINKGPPSFYPNSSNQNGHFWPPPPPQSKPESMRIMNTETRPSQYSPDLPFASSTTYNSAVPTLDNSNNIQKWLPENLNQWTEPTWPNIDINGPPRKNPETPEKLEINGSKIASTWESFPPYENIPASAAPESNIWQNLGGPTQRPPRIEGASGNPNYAQIMQMPMQNSQSQEMKYQNCNIPEMTLELLRYLESNKRWENSQKSWINNNGPSGPKNFRNLNEWKLSPMYNFNTELGKDTKEGFPSNHRPLTFTKENQGNPTSYSYVAASNTLKNVIEGKNMKNWPSNHQTLDLPEIPVNGNAGSQPYQSFPKREVFRDILKHIATNQSPGNILLKPARLRFAEEESQSNYWDPYKAIYKPKPTFSGYKIDNINTQKHQTKINYNNNVNSNYMNTKNINNNDHFIGNQQNQQLHQDQYVMYEFPQETHSRPIMVRDLEKSVGQVPKGFQSRNILNENTQELPKSKPSYLVSNKVSNKGAFVADWKPIIPTLSPNIDKEV